MAMKRIGIVGAGLMAGMHAVRWNQLPVELVGFYAPTREHAEAHAAKYGGRAMDSLEELLANVDAVDVCTPTAEHMGPVLAAAAAGKHVVCEKPLARHLADAEAMIAACEQAGVRLFVAQVVRFFPEFVQAKALIDSGKLGKLGVLRTVRGGDFPRPNSWYGDFEKSGGVIMDLSIHDIDYLRWCCGEVTRVFARGLSYSGIKATDHALLTLRFQNGAIGHIEGSWAYPGGNFRTFLEIAGDEGLLTFDSMNTSPVQLTLKQEAIEQGGNVTIPGGFLDAADDPYLLELAHFLEGIDSGEEFRVKPEDGLAALRISLAAMESVRTGKPVDIATFEETRS
jgi:predicted dehydrogenase